MVNHWAEPSSPRLSCVKGAGPGTPEDPRAGAMARKKTGQVPTRWSCAFSLGREGGRLQSCLCPAAFTLQYPPRDHTSPSNCTKDSPQHKNLQWDLGLCLKLMDSWDQGKNDKANHKAHPSKSRQERWRLDQCSISPFTREFSEWWENVVGEEVGARTTPAK